MDNSFFLQINKIVATKSYIYKRKLKVHTIFGYEVHIHVHSLYFTQIYIE